MRLSLRRTTAGPRPLDKIRLPVRSDTPARAHHSRNRKTRRSVRSFMELVSKANKRTPSARVARRSQWSLPHLFFDLRRHITSAPRGVKARLLRREIEHPTLGAIDQGAQVILPERQRGLDFALIRAA